MLPDNLDLDIATADQRKTIHESICVINAEEMKTLEEEIFPFKQDLWHDRYRKFMEENAGETFFYAAINDATRILYCYGKQRGIWFLPNSGVGILQEPALKVLKEIVEEVHLVPGSGSGK
jgi:hypothetical protein